MSLALTIRQTICLPGESLFAEDRRKDRTWQYMEYSYDNRRWISIRDRRYKYNYYYGGGCEELFDLDVDPDETTNLLAGGTPEDLAQVRLALRAKLVEYEAAWGLEGYVHGGTLLAGPHYEPHPQRNEAFPRFPDQIMDAHERAATNSLFDEVLEAVAAEPAVRLRDLDVAAWQAKGGFTDAQIEELLARDDQKHLQEP